MVVDRQQRWVTPGSGGGWGESGDVTVQPQSTRFGRHGPWTVRCPQ